MCNVVVIYLQGQQPQTQACDQVQYSIPADGVRLSSVGTNYSGLSPPLWVVAEAEPQRCGHGQALESLFQHTSRLSRGKHRR